jgi:hypothetical protein
MMLWQSDFERQAELDAAAGSGARWIAVDIDWPSIEYQAGQYRWDAIDQVIQGAHGRGLKVLGVIAYSPKWAQPADCPPATTHCLPADPQWYANFARVVAARYGSFASNPYLRNAVNAWQIWNEPNHVPFVHKVDAFYYTVMLKLAYNAIKSSDFFATVVAGGTAPAPDNGDRDMLPSSFLSSIYYFGGRGYFDAFGHHPYSFPCSPLYPASWNAFQQTLTLRWIMMANQDDAKKIWATETGAPTAADVGGCAQQNGRSVTENDQANFLLQYVTTWTRDWGSFTGPLFWFQIRDNGDNPWFYEDHFGLLRRDFSQKPSYTMFRALMPQSQ